MNDFFASILVGIAMGVALFAWFGLAYLAGSKLGDWWYGR